MCAGRIPFWTAAVSVRLMSLPPGRSVIHWPDVQKSLGSRVFRRGYTSPDMCVHARARERQGAGGREGKGYGVRRGGASDAEVRDHAVEGAKSGEHARFRKSSLESSMRRAAPSVMASGQL